MAYFGKDIDNTNDGDLEDKLPTFDIENDESNQGALNSGNGLT